MDKSRSVAPIIAAVLLLLPMLYVGSYFALVRPEFGYWGVAATEGKVYYHGYLNGGSWAPRLYWPLEKCHRGIQPHVWDTHGARAKRPGRELQTLPMMSDYAELPPTVPIVREANNDDQ